MKILCDKRSLVYNTISVKKSQQKSGKDEERIFLTTTEKNAHLLYRRLLIKPGFLL